MDMPVVVEAIKTAYAMGYARAVIDCRENREELKVQPTDEEIVDIIAQAKQCT